MHTYIHTYSVTYFGVESPSVLPNLNLLELQGYPRLPRLLQARLESM